MLYCRIQILFFFTSTLLFVHCQHLNTKPNTKVDVFLERIKLKVEVVNTPESREKGLMYRTKLGEYEGMLFVFPYPRETAFWMKNTLIPLDLAYFDEHHRLIEINSMIVDDGKKSYPSSSPILYALEVNYEWFKRQGLGKGSLLRLPYAIKGY